MVQAGGAFGCVCCRAFWASGSANSPKAELQAVSTGRKTNGKRTLEAVQDVGGGRVLRGVAGRGSSYIWAGEKIPCTLARLLICCPSPLPFPSSSLFLFGRVVRIGCRGGFQAGRDAGGRLLSAGSRRAAGRRAGRQAGQAVAGRLSVCLCPCPSACWAWCWRWRAGCLASSAGQGWRGRRVGAGACRCWAGCPGHQAGCYPSYCTKFRLKIQHNAENDASCFDTFTA